MPTDGQGARHEDLWVVIERLPIGVFVSRQGKIVYANPMLARYLGYERGEELLGFGPEQMLAPSDQADGRAIVVQRDAPFRPVQRRDWILKRRDGSLLTVETEVTQEIEFQGERAILWTVIDVTAFRNMQAQLVQADRLASVGLLAAGVAHEVNNPLTFVIAALEQLADSLPMLQVTDQDEVEKRDRLVRAVHEAQNGAERVRAIVRDLRTFSRTERQTQRVDPQAVLDSTVQMAMNELRARARLLRDYGPCPEVMASEASIGQVCLNLIINAVHAIPEGRPREHQIRLTTMTSPSGEAILEVSDTGQGIPPELVARVFDPFFTTKPVGIGTGLGLAICRNTVTALGGRIELDSTPGRGTTVRVTLPPAPPREADTIVERAPPAPVPSGRGRILLIDDEPAIVAALERVLGRDHEVVALTDARQALARIRGGERFDVIVSDLIMPEMTGMELHDELAATHPEQAERMLLLTGGAFTQAAASFLDRVPNPRMAKPFNTQELRSVVAQLVVAAS